MQTSFPLVLSHVSFREQFWTGNKTHIFEIYSTQASFANHVTRPEVHPKSFILFLLNVHCVLCIESIFNDIASRNKKQPKATGHFLKEPASLQKNINKRI